MALLMLACRGAESVDMKGSTCVATYHFACSGRLHSQAHGAQLMGYLGAVF